jgi:hypothetical protein
VCALFFDFCYQCATLPRNITRLPLLQKKNLPYLGYISKLFSILLGLILVTRDEELWSHGTH